MKTRLWQLTAGGLILMLASLACGMNVPTNISTPDLLGTVVGQTLASMTASASSSGLEAGTATLSSAASVSASPASTLNGVFTPSATPVLASSGPQNSLVTGSTLCWLGPGSVYEVSSAIQKGTRVELLGRGDISGWWVVRNPTYHDPCWLQYQYLQIDPGVNVSALPIFYTPATPTPTPTPVPTATP